jgi:membrane protease YdiL (CAAX protease family)
MSNLFSPNSVEKARIEYFQIAWILWIPVVEEIVFRVGVGNFFRKLGSISLGSYFSAIVFALVHSSLSLKNLFSLNFFLPLGPLLLGLIAEFLYLKSDKKVFPIIAFHASCNLSVVVFSMFDARWLTWLRLLYI